VNVKVIKAEKPAFGLALVAALEGFRFEPAKRAGSAVPHVLNFEQDFNLTEFRDERVDALIALEKKSPEKIVASTTLDVPLKPTLRRDPVFPISVSPQITTGEAEVECLVDIDGSVRLARIASASDPAFGYAAVQAASGWWFEPPQMANKAVVARTRIPFSFSAKAATP
jgi:TonB family protein